MILKKTPIFTPFSELDESPNLFSPSSLSFTPAGIYTSAPKIDDIMSSCIFPTPNKSSPRIDLNSEMNDRPMKDSISAEDSDEPRVKLECSDSPDWTSSVSSFRFLSCLFSTSNLISHDFFYFSILPSHYSGNRKKSLHHLQYRRLC